MFGWVVHGGHIAVKNGCQTAGLKACIESLVVHVRRVISCLGVPERLRRGETAVTQACTMKTVALVQACGPVFHLFGGPREGGHEYQEGEKSLITQALVRLS